jgi:hypothetical protein
MREEYHIFLDHPCPLLSGISGIKSTPARHVIPARQATWLAGRYDIPYARVNFIPLSRIYEFGYRKPHENAKNCTVLDLRKHLEID